MSGIDLDAAKAGMADAARLAFTTECETEYRLAIARLAGRAQELKLPFGDAMSAITTGGQTSVIRLLAKFTAFETSDELAELACGVVREIVPDAWIEAQDSISLDPTKGGDA